MKKNINKTHSKKADLPLNYVFVSVVAIVSILLLLGIFSGKMPVFAKDAYCHTLYYIFSSNLIPEGIRADQNYCTINSGISVTVIGIHGCNLGEEAVAHAVSCFERVNRGKYSRNFACEEIVATSACPSVLFDETKATQVLYSKGLCGILSNNDANPLCGTANQLDWMINAINSTTNILIQYDNATGRIQVK